MIQYAPIEHTFVEGQDLYLIYCIWVHGYKKGRGNFQKRGMGKALLKAAESDAKEKGAKGMVAWGISLPFWMRASWFKKIGKSIRMEINPRRIECRTRGISNTPARRRRALAVRQCRLRINDGYHQIPYFYRS